MGTANLLQQSSTISKESINFRLRGCKFFLFLWALGWQPFCSWRRQRIWKIFELLIRFWEPILGPVLVTLSCLFSFKGPKFELQNWTQKSESWNVFPLHSSRIKVANPGPTKARKTHPAQSREFTDSLRWLKIAGANYQCPSNWKMAHQRENQMNIPNFCSRMLTEHSNSKIEFFSYIEATSKWSQKPLYFETLFWGPGFGPREHL